MWRHGGRRLAGALAHGARVVRRGLPAGEAVRVEAHARRVAAPREAGVALAVCRESWRCGRRAAERRRRLVERADGAGAAQFFLRCEDPPTFADAARVVAAIASRETTGMRGMLYTPSLNAQSTLSI